MHRNPDAGKRKIYFKTKVKWEIVFKSQKNQFFLLKIAIYSKEVQKI